MITLWRKFPNQSQMIGSLTLTLRTNRLLASHTLQQIISQLEFIKDPKECLLKSDEITPILTTLMPNGIPLFIGTPDSLFKQIPTIDFNS